MRAQMSNQFFRFTPRSILLDNYYRLPYAHLVYLIRVPLLMLFEDFQVIHLVLPLDTSPQECPNPSNNLRGITSLSNIGRITSELSQASAAIVDNGRKRLDDLGATDAASSPIVMTRVPEHCCQTNIARLSTIIYGYGYDALIMLFRCDSDLI